MIERRLGAPGDGWGPATRAIHAGQEPDATTGSVVTPVVLASTFAQDGVGRPRAYEYARSANPTRDALETCLASLEGARFGLAFASGMAAIDAVLRALAGPGPVVIPTDVYGGTYRLLAEVLDVAFEAVDLTDAAAVPELLPPGTSLVWLESPTNPRLSIIDLAAVAAEAHRRGAVCVVDNTFATPLLQHPLAVGADVVVHSTTKYLGGHSDVLGGFVGLDDPGLARRLHAVQRGAGAVPGPLDCFLVLRGVKTLAVRMAAHCANARAVAELLLGHPAVAEVRYPGLPTHPGHAVARTQMSGFGGMVSATLAGGEEAARSLAGGLELFTLGESLGGVESLVAHPATMSHAPLGATPLAADPALVRLSVGIESLEDLVADLQAGLARLAS